MKTRCNASHAGNFFVISTYFAVYAALPRIIDPQVGFLREHELMESGKILRPFVPMKNRLANTREWANSQVFLIV
jgi:hypothetical protein